MHKQSAEELLTCNGDIGCDASNKRCPVTAALVIDTVDIQLKQDGKEVFREASKFLLTFFYNT